VRYDDGEAHDEDSRKERWEPVQWVGTVLRAMDRCGKLLDAKIVDERVGAGAVELRVHFKGWSRAQDEWIPALDDVRLRFGADSEASEAVPAAEAASTALVVAGEAEGAGQAAELSEACAKRAKTEPGLCEQRSPAAEALRQATVEGLTLERSSRAPSGFTGVCASTSGRFECRSGREWVGTYDTAEEAALARARAMAAAGRDSKDEEAEEAPPPPLPLPPPPPAEEDGDQHEEKDHDLAAAAAEALRHAKAEGLTLETSERASTGYRGVSVQAGRFRTALNGTHLGQFGTAEEAALARARAAAAAVGPADVSGALATADAVPAVPAVAVAVAADGTEQQPPLGLCGNQGCILANNHTGLCIIPDPAQGRRRSGAAPLRSPPLLAVAPAVVPPLTASVGKGRKRKAEEASRP
jgi:hypothetical protein